MRLPKVQFVAWVTDILLEIFQFKSMLCCMKYESITELFLCPSLKQTSSYKREKTDPIWFSFYHCVSCVCLKLFCLIVNYSNSEPNSEHSIRHVIDWNHRHLAKLMNWSRNVLFYWFLHTSSRLKYIVLIINIIKISWGMT